MTSRRVHWFDVDVVGTMSIPSPGLDNVTAQAAVADDDDDDDDFALHPHSLIVRSFESNSSTRHPLICVVEDWIEFLNHRQSRRLRHHVSWIVNTGHVDDLEHVVVNKLDNVLGLHVE